MPSLATGFDIRIGLASVADQIEPMQRSSQRISRSFPMSTCFDRLVEAGGERVPAEGGALDAHGELHHAPQGLQIA